VTPPVAGLPLRRPSPPQCSEASEPWIAQPDGGYG
jgi:hypothetical protein